MTPGCQGFPSCELSVSVPDWQLGQGDIGSSQGPSLYQKLQPLQVEARIDGPFQATERESKLAGLRETTLSLRIREVEGEDYGLLTKS